jgi:hypothetical protein
MITTTGICYIGIRTDGLSGNGTKSNPYDGSTAEKFDKIMREMPENIIINLLEGTFETTGSATFNDSKGYYLKNGWKIRGKGIDKTIIKRIAFPADTGGGNGHVVFQMPYYSLGNVEVSNLTIDENWHNLNANPNNCSSAVQLYGNNNIIRRVKAINGYGNKSFGREAFILTICSRYNGNLWEDNTNGLIEYCEIDGFRGDYGVGMALVFGGDGRLAKFKE